MDVVLHRFDLCMYSEGVALTLGAKGVRYAVERYDGRTLARIRDISPTATLPLLVWGGLRGGSRMARLDVRAGAEGR